MKLPSKSALAAWSSQDCALRCLDIIDFCSPLTKEEIVERLTDSTTLGQLQVTKSQCDRGVRVLINRKVRTRNGKPRLLPGSVKPTTKVQKLISDSCD